jgi:chromosomal replication initiator protein
LDILLVDDVHFIAGKEATQEEFFHTFNTLHDDHKQIVISSDRPPKDIPGLEERLVSRFQWGLVVDIQPPDLETRLAILRKKVAREKTRVPDDVLGFIASKIKSNIRELEGSLLRVLAFASLTGSPITVEVTQEILKDSLLEESKKITIDLVQRKTAEYYDISISDMRVKRRSKTIAFPRQVAMYLVRELTDHSLPEIGQYFGGRDHTTVLHAYNKILKDIKGNPSVKKAIEHIKHSLTQ